MTLHWLMQAVVALELGQGPAILRNIQVSDNHFDRPLASSPFENRRKTDALWTLTNLTLLDIVSNRISGYQACQGGESDDGELHGWERFK
jgi:hypothetical protein